MARMAPRAEFWRQIMSAFDPPKRKASKNCGSKFGAQEYPMRGVAHLLGFESEAKNWDLSHDRPDHFRSRDATRDLPSHLPLNRYSLPSFLSLTFQIQKQMRATPAPSIFPARQNLEPQFLDAFRLEIKKRSWILSPNSAREPCEP